jgi:hypothetical protein
VVRPGTILQVTVFPAQGLATVESNRVNSIGVLEMLHTFTGVRIGEPEKSRDWILTRLWSISIDAVSAGLLLIVASGLFFAFRRREAFGLKIIVLGLGVVSCCFFLFGL